MSDPTFTPAPTAPARTQAKAVFNANMAGFLAWMVTFSSECIAFVTWIGVKVGLISGYADAAASASSSASAAAAAALGVTTRAGSSITPNSVGSGTKTFAITESGRTLHQCTAVLIGAKADLDSVMYLVIDAGASSAGSITGTVAADGFRIGTGGSGPYSAWQIIDAFYAQQGAEPAEIWAGANNYLATSPKALRLAAAFQTLTETSTIAWDTATQGFNAKVTLTANRTMGAPTNLQDGVTYTLQPIQGGSGSYTLSWASIWDFGVPGLPNLSTAVGKEDKVVAQYNAARGKLEASFRKAG